MRWHRNAAFMLPLTLLPSPFLLERAMIRTILFMPIFNKGKRLQIVIHPKRFIIPLRASLFGQGMGIGAVLVRHFFERRVCRVLTLTYLIFITLSKDPSACCLRRREGWAFVDELICPLVVVTVAHGIEENSMEILYKIITIQRNMCRYRCIKSRRWEPLAILVSMKLPWLRCTNPRILLLRCSPTCCRSDAECRPAIVDRTGKVIPFWRWGWRAGIVLLLIFGIPWSSLSYAWAVVSKPLCCFRIFDQNFRVSSWCRMERCLPLVSMDSLWCSSRCVRREWGHCW